MRGSVRWTQAAVIQTIAGVGAVGPAGLVLAGPSDGRVRQRRGDGHAGRQRGQRDGGSYWKAQPFLSTVALAANLADLQHGVRSRPELTP